MVWPTYRQHLTPTTTHMSAYSRETSSSPHANRIRLGKLLEKYNGRILGGIRMSIDKSSGHPNRYKYFFIKLTDEPAIIVKDPRYRPPGWREILREKQPPGWEKILEEDEKTKTAEHPAQNALQKTTRDAADPAQDALQKITRDAADAQSPDEKHAAPRVVFCNAELQEEGKANETTSEVGSNLEQEPEPEQLNPVLKNPVDQTEGGCLGSTTSHLGISAATDLKNSTPRRTDPAPLFALSWISPGVVLPPCEALNSASSRSKKSARSGGVLLSAVAPLMPNSPVHHPDIHPPFSLHPDIHPPFLALDLETFAAGAKSGALDPWKGNIRLINLADAEGNISRFDLRELEGGKLPAALIEAIEGHTLVIHNAAFDLRWLAVKFDLRPRNVFCTKIASRLLTPLKSVSHEFGVVLERYTGIKLVKDQGASNWGADSLSKEQIEYAENDVRYSIQLAAALTKVLCEKRLDHVFALEMQLLPLVTWMEVRGIGFNLSAAQALLNEVQDKADEKLLAIRNETGIENFNPNSTPHCVEYFKTKGYKMQRRTRQGEDRDSADENALCAVNTPLASEIITYRRLDTLVSALNSTFKHVHPDGRIHALYNQVGAVTGRFSSGSPNMQQVPKRHDEYGSRVRSLYEASSGRRLVRADYGQFELRGTARVAPEPVMCQAFIDGSDLHVKIVALALGLDPSPLQTCKGISWVSRRTLGLFMGENPRVGGWGFEKTLEFYSPREKRRRSVRRFSSCILGLPPGTARVLAWPFPQLMGRREHLSGGSYWPRTTRCGAGSPCLPITSCRAGQPM